MPTHLIYGAIDDVLYVTRLRLHEVGFDSTFFRPADVKKDVIDVAAGGVQNLASLSRVEGAGHLVRLISVATHVTNRFDNQVVQVNPKGLAQHIYDALARPTNLRANL